MALASNALTTVATLAYELGIDVPTGAALEHLERLINTASGAVEAWCRRKFFKATLTEYVRGHGTQHLMVQRTPILSLTSVAYDGTALEADEYASTDEEKEAGLIRHVDGYWEDTSYQQVSPSPEGMPGTEQPDYTVVYVAGYVLPKDATGDNPRTLPYEVEHACLLACVDAYRAKGRESGIASESLMSASVSYRAPEKGASGLPLQAEAMLEPHRRLV